MRWLRRTRQPRAFFTQGKKSTAALKVKMWAVSSRAKDSRRPFAENVPA